MKTRSGFVSNSRSSSFVIFGNYVENIAQLSQKDIKDGIVVIGRDFGEGDDVFKVTTKAMMDFVIEHKDYFTAYRNADMVCGEGDTKCDQSMVGKTMYVIEVSMHSSTSLKDLKEMYKEDEEGENA